MSNYFTIWLGLRGSYMPDSAYIIHATTRKELKSALEQESYYIREAGGVGLSKRTIASLAAAVWKYRKASPSEYVAPYRWTYQDSYPYALGVFTGMTRKEYLEQDQ